MPDIYINGLISKPKHCYECPFSDPDYERFDADTNTGDWCCRILDSLMKPYKVKDGVPDYQCPLKINYANREFSFRYDGCEKCGSKDATFTFTGRGNGIHVKCNICGNISGVRHLEKLSKRTNGALSEWAYGVKKRDGFICQRCGTGRVLEAHHMIPVSEDPEMRWKYEPVNGIALCHSCHAREHKLQRNWEKIMKDASNGGKMYSKYFGSGADKQSFEF